MARIDNNVIIDTPYIFYCSPLLGYIVITDSSNYAKSVIYVYHISLMKRENLIGQLFVYFLLRRLTRNIFYYNFVKIKTLKSLLFFTSQLWENHNKTVI